MAGRAQPEPDRVSRILAEAPAKGLRETALRLEEAGLALIPPPSPAPGYRIEPARDWTFPAGEVRRAYRDGQGRPVIETHLLALDGGDSPLPSYWLEAAAGEEGGERVHCWLAGINTRVHAALLAAWRAASARGDGDPDGWRRAWWGFARGHEGPDPRAGLLDLFARGAPTRRGVERLVQRLTGVSAVQVRDRLPRTCAVDAQPPRLGEQVSLRLDGSACLGGRVAVAAGRLHVRIGPLPRAEAARLAPGADAGRSLAGWLRRYIGPEPTVHAEVLVEPEAHAAVGLGGDGAPLGGLLSLGERSDATVRMPLPV